MNKTDNEIIKALKCHKAVGINTCGECPYKERMCSITLTKDALDLINRQKAEIERLQAMNQAKLDTIHDLGEDYERVLEEEPILIQKAKVEAIKEFAERLKTEFEITPNTRKIGRFFSNLFRNTIDDLVKEMTEKE